MEPYQKVSVSSSAAGMSAGLSKFVTVNLQQLNSKFADGETVDLNTLQEKRMLNLSGRESKLPLKVRHIADCWTWQSF